MNTSVIDTEVHLLHPEAIHSDFAENSNEPVRKAIHDHPDFPNIQEIMSFEALLHSMEKNSVEHCHLMGMSWRNKKWQDDNNAYIKECVRKYPRKFSGFYIPNLEDPSVAAQEIRNLDSSIFIGIKFLPSWQGVHINDPVLEPVMRAIKDRDFFVMVHTDQITQSLDGDTPQRFFDFIQKNPDLKVVAPHLGGLLCYYQLLPKIQEKLKNVYYITSLSATMELVKFAAEINPDNIVFGTDFPFNHCHDQATQIKKLDEFGLSDEVQEKILYRNAMDIFPYNFNEKNK